MTLEKLKGRDGFDDEMLEALKQHDMSVLAEIPLSRRNDRKYMGDLLFAVWNHCQSFIVYQYCGASIQADPVIALEVFMNDPSLIEGTHLSCDERFIIQAARVCPEITGYINPVLNKDEEFVERLNKVVNSQEARTKEVFERAEEIIKRLEGEPELVQDREFMHEAISVNANFLLQASLELKNDTEFLKAEIEENEEVISVVAKNIEEFELEGIKAVQESSKKLTIDDCLNLINEFIEKSDDVRFEKVKNKIDEVREAEKREIEERIKAGENIEPYDGEVKNPRVMKWVTAMVAQRDDLDPKLVKKVLDYSILTMEKTKQDVGEDGKMKLTLENAQLLITPTIINRIKASLEKQGIPLENDYEKAIADYTTFYEDFNKQFKAKKKIEFAKLIAQKEQEEKEKNQSKTSTNMLFYTELGEVIQTVSQDEINMVTAEIIAAEENREIENSDDKEKTQKNNGSDKAKEDKAREDSVVEPSVGNDGSASEDAQDIIVEID